MLRIRREQMEVFKRLAEERFEDEMYAYLCEAFPDDCGAEGEEQTRENIRAGLRRAEQYGITIENDVARYVELMYVWSPQFDEDPLLPWASAILNAQGLDGTEKVDELWAQSDALVPGDPHEDTDRE
jgi:hypothetical protein